jgi:fatty-acid peroxygenase
LARICGHRDLEGRFLTDSVAAVELLNLLRPIVAVARFIVFAVAMLDAACRRRVLSGDVNFVMSYAQEVRRWSPFFPVIGGIVMEPFVWEGHTFGKNDWVLLDLFGTNRDAGTWPEPSMFVPERFLFHTPTLYDLIPQGGGDATLTHRCPGESLTIALIAEAVRMFAADLVYQLPPQDLTIDLSRIPALPASGLLLQNLRLAAPAASRVSAGQGGR